MANEVGGPGGLQALTPQFDNSVTSPLQAGVSADALQTGATSDMLQTGTSENMFQLRAEQTSLGADADTGGLDTSAEDTEESDDSDDSGCEGQMAARIGDLHSCPMAGPAPHVGGPVLLVCSADVFTEGIPQARVTDLCVCTGCGGPVDMIVKGSSCVFVNELPAARVTDQTAHGGVILKGATSVFIGDCCDNSSPPPPMLIGNICGDGDGGGKIPGNCLQTNSPFVKAGVNDGEPSMPVNLPPGIFGPFGGSVDTNIPLNPPGTPPLPANATAQGLPPFKLGANEDRRNDGPSTYGTGVDYNTYTPQTVGTPQQPHSAPTSRTPASNQPRRIQGTGNTTVNVGGHLLPLSLKIPDVSYSYQNGPVVPPTPRHRPGDVWINKYWVDYSAGQNSATVNAVQLSNGQVVSMNPPANIAISKSSAPTRESSPRSRRR